MDFHPHEYQEIAIQRIIDHSHYGLLLDMGLGKTISTLIAIERLMYDYFDIKKVLLIAPKKVAESTWAQETQKWSATRRLTVAKVLGSEKERIQALESESDLYVINRENVQWLYNTVPDTLHRTKQTGTSCIATDYCLAAIRRYSVRCKISV